MSTFPQVQSGTPAALAIFEAEREIARLEAMNPAAIAAMLPAPPAISGTDNEDPF